MARWICSKKRIKVIEVVNGVANGVANGVVNG